MQRSAGGTARFRLSAFAPAALLLAGCWEAQPRATADPRLVQLVQVSRREPLGCWPLGAVSGRAADANEDSLDYQAAYDDVRNNAALRGGNLVVIDAVGQPRMLTGSIAVYDYSIAGRLFRCPTSGYDAAPAQASRSDESAPSCSGQCCNAEE
ncbi:MAG TPA: hypothetical protein VFF06_09025 [Polyangia bacterium]|nr:hypothetical protein [Polyangia bacterium]